MPNIAELTAQNAQRWKRARPTRSFAATAQRLCAAKPRYQSVTGMTGVPWWCIAVIHEREANGKWDAQLGQGDPLDKVSIHVPKGRGPFKTWEVGAVDALVNCDPHASKWKDWTAGGALTLLETYNGLGYASRNLPSPYVWSGTDQYSKGKFVRDHVFDPDVIDVQPGCAALLLAMREIDSTIRFANEFPPPPDIESVPPSKPIPIVPAKHATAATAVAVGTVAAVKASTGWEIAAIAVAVIIVLSAIYFFTNRSK